MASGAMETATVRPPVPTTCGVCEELFPSRTAYLVHHKTCRKCTEIFESKGELKEHMKEHRVSFVCDLCETEPFG